MSETWQVWVFAGSIAYGVPFKFLPAHQYKEGTDARDEFQLLCTCNPNKS